MNSHFLTVWLIIFIMLMLLVEITKELWILFPSLIIVFKPFSPCEDEFLFLFYLMQWLITLIMLMMLGEITKELWILFLSLIIVFKLTTLTSIAHPALPLFNKLLFWTCTSKSFCNKKYYKFLSYSSTTIYMMSFMDIQYL